METQKNVVTEDSAESSNTYNDKITVPNNLFNNLIDNLEEFEGRVSLDIEKVYKKFEEQIASQSKLIESLRSRIEYLEIDSAAKDEDIKNLRHDIRESFLSPAQDIMNENVSNDQFIEPLNVDSSRNFQYKPEKTIKCKKCRKVFTSHEKLCEHDKEKHSHKCSVCHQLFSSKKKRRKHMRKSHMKEFSCNLCSKKSYFISGLREHFRAKHSGGKFFPSSSNSSKTTTTSQSVTAKFIHEIIPYQFPSNNIPPYQLKCTICEEIFNTHSLFNKHAQSSHDYNLTCPECSQVFSQKALRKQHIKKKYACQFCNKRVKGEGGLISHCKAKHSHLSVEEIYSELIGIQFPTLREQISTQKEDELNELKLAYEKGLEEDNDSYGDNFTEEENEESNDDYNTEEENEGSGDTEDGDEASDDNDYTEEENEGSDDDST